MASKIIIKQNKGKNKNRNNISIHINNNNSNKKEKHNNKYKHDEHLMDIKFKPRMSIVDMNKLSAVAAIVIRRRAEDRVVAGVILSVSLLFFALYITQAL